MHAQGGACMPGGRECLGVEGACMVRGCVYGEACIPKGVHGRGVCVAGDTATAAAGTHPTGMHYFTGLCCLSCLFLFLDITHNS